LQLEFFFSTEILFSSSDGNSLQTSLHGEANRKHIINTRENDLNRIAYKAFQGSDEGVTMLKQNDDEDASKNCTPRSVDEFPRIFTFECPQGVVILCATFFGLYCFILTAFVCNDYLLPALDIICLRLKISSDVAGATFLATASCFPELFVNIVGTFLTQSDLGVGTVMGSAVFNTFATPACGALSAIHVSIKLNSSVVNTRINGAMTTSCDNVAKIL
jgi:hypothetical protein